MATGTSDGKREETFGYDIDPVVDDIVLHAHEAVTEREEAKGSEIARVFGGGGQFIGGELLDNENIIRFILVKAANDIIAIAPGKWIICVLTVPFDLALGIAIAGDIEQMPATAFAVSWSRQQTVYDFLDSIGQSVID